MAQVIHSNVKVEVAAKIYLELTEEEARALDGIFGYNVEAFLKAFYEKMGKSYVEPHEEGVRSLHKTIRSVLAGPLSEISKARQLIRNAVKQPRSP